MFIGITLILCSMLYTGLLCIVYLSKKRIKNMENRIYNVLIFANFICLIFELLCCFFVPEIEKFYTLTFLINKLFLISILFWMALFTRYIFVISFDNDSILSSKLKEKDKLIFNTFWLFSIICAIILWILPLNYYYDGTYVYSYGIGTNFLYSIVVLYMIILISSVIVNIKKVSKKKVIPLFAFLICVTIAMIVRAINPGILLITATQSFITILMFFTIENPDMKLINQLNIAKDTAEKANNAKTDFLSSMSHEIRTPLNAIVGFSECIKQSDSLEEAQENAADVIKASSTLLEIVNGILDISKIEAGKIEITNSNYSTKELFESIEKLMRARMGNKNLDLRIKIAPDIPNVLYGDYFNIKKVLLNLLTNAVKYTEKGFVEFRVNCVNTKDLCRLVIAVEDSGRGIKEEHIDKLFVKFQRLEEDRNTTLEGTGLGLAITKRLVELMGGTIVVQSVYGSGSKFTVALDQGINVNDAKTENEEINGNSELDLTGKKVLIVDDNKLNLKVAGKILALCNASVDSVLSGQESIDLIKKGNKYDLILMDDMMPKMRGIEALKILKEIEGFNIPVIALTANAVTGMREKYLKEGFDEYLAKPIDRKELNKVVYRVLNKDHNGSDYGDELKDLSKYKVLIVDDNKINIKIAMRFLEFYQLQIDSVLSGQECIDKINKNEYYDLIFMDDMMPELRGVETFKKLKKMDNFKIPVTVLTANAVEGAREEYLRIGFNDYLSKPINKKELERVLKRFLIDKEN